MVRTSSAALWLAAALTAQPAVTSAASSFPPGQYEITWHTVMPHLDEMRQQSSVATRCLDGSATPLFPVFQQPALRGCVLESPGGDEYGLHCQSERVATGHARVVTRPGGVDGDLNIKMGGKNMTFSQHVRATYRGSCDQR